MEPQNDFICTICGEGRPGRQRWFLVVEDRWLDKLKILHWDDRLATVPGMHCVCSAQHLQQLVIHWMTTGSVDHPFARVEFGLEGYQRRRSLRPPASVMEGTRGQQIGELAVHRESMQRVLGERPECLQTILDALLSALQREPRRDPAREWPGLMPDRELRQA